MRTLTGNLKKTLHQGRQSLGGNRYATNLYCSNTLDPKEIHATYNQFKNNLSIEHSSNLHKPKYSQWSCYLPYEDYLCVCVFKDKITWLALKISEQKEVLRKMFQPVLGSLEAVDRINGNSLFGDIKMLPMSNFSFESA